METKINVAKILKDKLQGTKLYDLLRNIDVELDKVHTTDVGTYIECTSTNEVGNTLVFDYSKLGTEESWFEGLQILLPSKDMRDWGKFAWKKGDVLKNTAYEERVIFDGFLNNDYTYFKGKHPLDCSNKLNITYHEECNCFTGNYRLESTDAAQTYINTIEERLVGKLNLKTLGIEKALPEFKDGDIAYADYGHKQAVFIVSGKTNLSEGYNSFIALDLRGLTLDMGCRMSFFKKDLFELRLATEEEKYQLFSALAKEGKAWDADKKMIIDLKQKVELKPFDKVLVRDSQSDKWRVNLFGYIDKDEYYHCAFANWVYCIPYAGNEHLLGTTKDVEG